MSWRRRAGLLARSPVWSGPYTPEIEGLGIDVGLSEEGPDVVQAALHHGQMQR